MEVYATSNYKGGVGKTTTAVNLACIWAARGKRVLLVGLPCDAAWRTDAGVALGGPAFFGFDIPYVPIEERYETFKGEHTCAL